MTIPVTCRSCGKAYSAKESAAGKLSRCKNCDSVFSIPQPQSDADVELDSWEVDVELEEREPPPVRRTPPKKKPVAATARKRRVPRQLCLPVMAAMLVEALLIAFNGFNLLMA